MLPQQISQWPTGGSFSIDLPLSRCHPRALATFFFSSLPWWGQAPQLGCVPASPHPSPQAASSCLASKERPPCPLPVSATTEATCQGGGTVGLEMRLLLPSQVPQGKERAKSKGSMQKEIESLMQPPRGRGWREDSKSHSVIISELPTNAASKVLSYRHRDTMKGLLPHRCSLVTLQVCDSPLSSRGPRAFAPGPSTRTLPQLQKSMNGEVLEVWENAATLERAWADIPVHPARQKSYLLPWSSEMRLYYQV